MKIKITVTQKHIDNWNYNYKINSDFKHPFALAFYDSWNTVKFDNDKEKQEYDEFFDITYKPFSVSVYHSYNEIVLWSEGTPFDLLFAIGVIPFDVIQQIMYYGLEPMLFYMDFHVIDSELINNEDLYFYINSKQEKIYL